MSESRPTPPAGYRLSSTPSPPLSPAAAERMLNSATWEARAEVAGQDELAPEHTARLVLDDVEAVRHMLYAVRRDIPQPLLNEALARHPEDAAQIAFQQQAPLAALRVKEFNFATRTHA